MTGPWLVRRLAGDARRHAGAWLGLAVAFAIAAFCAAGARATARERARHAETGAVAEPPALVITYLKDDLPPADVVALQRVLTGLPGVEAARLVSPREALERLRGELGARAALVDGVGPELLFSSIEVTVRPAGAASALAFRLRRLAGVADVDLVAPSASSTSAARLGVGTRTLAVGGGALGLVVVLLVGGALARLRGRYRGELRVLATLGLSRAAGARPAVALATGAGALGVAAGSLSAFFAARALFGGASVPAREWGVGAVALVAAAYVLSAGVLRVRDVVEAG